MIKNQVIRLRKRSDSKNALKTNFMLPCTTIKLGKWLENKTWLTQTPSLITIPFQWVRYLFLYRLQHLQIQQQLRNQQVVITCLHLNPMLQLATPKGSKVVDSKSRVIHISHWIWCHLSKKTKNRAPNTLNTSVKLIKRQKRHREQEVFTNREAELMGVMGQEDRDKRYRCTSLLLTTYVSDAETQDITLRIAQQIRMKHSTHITERESPKSICGKETSVSVRKSSLRISHKISEKLSRRCRSFSQESSSPDFKNKMMYFKTCMIQWTNLLILKRFQLKNSICLLLSNVIFVKAW